MNSLKLRSSHEVTEPGLQALADNVNDWALLFPSHQPQENGRGNSRSGYISYWSIAQQIPKPMSEPGVTLMYESGARDLIPGTRS
jgi:hypothetical protein